MRHFCKKLSHCELLKHLLSLPWKISVLTSCRAECTQKTNPFLSPTNSHFQMGEK